MDNSNKNIVITPASYLRNAYLARTGVILSNISLACLIISLSSFLSVIFIMLSWILGFFLIIVSVGTIFAVIPNYWQLLTSSASTMSNVLAVLTRIAPYLAIVGVLASVASIVLLSLDKNKSHPARITFSAVVCGLIILSFVIILIEGIN